MLFWLIKISIFFTLTLASPVDRRAVQPANDPFYTPYPGWESQRPGTILATREILAAQLGFLPTGSVKTYQLLYKTSDQDDRPLASVTTILVPLVRANDRFVSYSVAEDSGNSKCAPSYQYQFGSDASNAIAQAELLVLQTALSQGWIVSIPDYQGPNSAWISGRLQGRSVLDSIRATLSHPPLGFNSATKVGLWGYSGGANAVGWAASLHPNYASELNIVGVAQGGTPANITAAALLLDGSPFSGFVPIAFHGLGAGYPQFKQRIDQVITPAFQSALDVVRSKCAVDLLLAYGNTAFFPGNTYFNGTGFALLDDPIIKPILDSLTLGSTGKGETPRAPLLVYHSGNDQVVPYPPAVTMVNNYCANGATVQFVTNMDSSVGHVLQEPLAIPRVIAYLRDRFDGKPISGCQRVQVGVSSTAGAIADAIQFGLPGLSGLITAAIAVFQTLPAV